MKLTTNIVLKLVTNLIAKLHDQPMWNFHQRLKGLNADVYPFPLP